MSDIIFSSCNKFETKKVLLKKCQDKFGLYATNDLIKATLSLALADSEYFTDMVTGVVDTFYTHPSKPENLSDIRKGNV